LHRIKKILTLLLCHALLGLALLGAATYQTHTVRRGDNLYNLAKRYGVTVKELIALNNLSSNDLSVGQELKIRPETSASSSSAPQTRTMEGNVYTVKSGDNLGAISKMFGITVDELRKLNNITGNRIDVGQKLKIKADEPPKPKPQETRTAAPATEQTTETGTYIVKRGDNLSNIAKNHGMTLEEIKQLNNITDNRLDVGQKLKVKADEPPKPRQQETKPAPAAAAPAFEEITYVVKRGDNLSEIAKKHETTVDEIKKLSNLSSNRLSVGQKLKIKVPVKTPPPKKEPPATVTPSTPPPATRQPVTAVTDTSGVKQPGISRARTVTPDMLPPDYFHEVKAGENPFRIAVNSGITLDELKKFNNVSGTDLVIRPGQRLIIKDPATFASSAASPEPGSDTEDDITEEVPPTTSDSVLIEKVYIVQRKDTLFKIARENGITVEELKRLNNLRSNNISVGQKLYIVTSNGKQPSDSSYRTVTEDDLKTKAVIRTDLIMPVDGKILSEYGIRNGRPHKGIDLGAPSGNPVFAVLDGTVVYSGLQGNYGNVVVIEHPEYVMTVYAHNEKNLVSVGEIVKKGQIIATVGSTGNATTPHVHFEYRIKGKAINPRKVLPLSK